MNVIFVILGGLDKLFKISSGNRKLTEFINKEYPNLKNLSLIYFYQTYAMDYYRKYLIYLI